jgi:hypothetical protein
MKFSFAIIATAFASEDNVADDTWVGPLSSNSTAVARSGVRQIESGERRYDDLESIASKYWRKQGLTGKSKFDDRKYWTYGCHCLMLGDRPMSEMGAGKPVDALDNKCKAYKDCQKCVREKHGDTCIGEFVRYTWRYATKRQAFESKNAPGSCERELFECDLQFVKDTYSTKDVWTEDYHLFWSKTGWDNEDANNCPSGGNGPVEHQCCGGHTSPYYWINLNKFQCCPDYRVIGADDQC